MKMNEFALLSTKRFMPLFVTQFLGALNDNVFKNTLIILITYQVAHLAGLNSQGLVALAAGLFILPFLLFSATAGSLADHYEKSRLITIIKFIEIILMGTAASGFYSQNIYLLMFVLFGLGTHAAFFGPLKYSILPELLNEKELIAGNGFIEAGTFFSILLGTILSGVLIGHEYGRYIISIMVIAIAILGWISSFFIPNTKTMNEKTFSIHLNIYKETISLLKFSKQYSAIFLCILGISWFWVIGATLLAEMPVFSKEILHANESAVTLFLALFSVGLMIGSLLCNKLLNGKIHATYVPLGALAVTAFLIDLVSVAKSMSAIHNEHFLTFYEFISSFNGLRISADLLLMAVSCGIYVIPLYAILQQRSEKGYCSRIIASNNIVNALFMVLAAVMTVVLSKFGLMVSQVFLILALFNALVAIYICRLIPETIIKFVLRSILKMFYRVKVTGLENYVAAGERIVIVANHTSLIDALLLATFLPDKLTFAVNKNIAKKWWAKLFLQLVDAHPVDPTNPMAIKTLIELSKNNCRCVIFPEGRLSMTGTLMKIYEGPGLVADKSKAKLLPIRIDGAQLTPFSYLKGKVPVLLLPKITISILPPESLDIPEDCKGKRRRKKIGFALYDVMTNLIFKSSQYQKTLFSSLIETYEKHGLRHKIIEDIERKPISLFQLIMRSFILGQKIHEKTSQFENVGILLPNMSVTVVAFFALHAVCRVPAMLNYSTGIKNILLATQSAKINYVITSRRFVERAKLADMIHALISENKQIIYLEDVVGNVSFYDKLLGLLRAYFPLITYKKYSKNSADLSMTPAVILFTSGSEGTPKGVVLSHANLQANRFQLSACIDFNLKDKVFNALPLFHSFGLTGGTLLPLLSGIKIFFYPSPLHYRIIPELSYDSNASILFGTDTFLANYAKYANPYDFYSIRYVFAGAEKLKDDTRLLWLQKFGVRILEGYGATECSPVIATNTPMHNKCGTVGRIIPGMAYQLRHVPGIENGSELIVSGPNVMSGYLFVNDPGILKSPENSIYPTGDIVSIDDEGFVTILGRAKRFAKIAGEMVSLPMVEQQISQLWPEYQHAVISVSDVKRGEQLVLVTTYLDATREQVVNFAKKIMMGEVSIPRKIVTLREMVLLGSGKIDYAGLKNLIEAKAV